MIKYKILNKLINVFSPFLSDKLFMSLKFRIRKGYWMNWKDPQTFCEKMQWLKLYDRNSEYTIMTDKVKAKDWVANKIGEQYIIPTLGVWEKPEDVDFDSLPEKFVLKCNHNSGLGMIICKDKSKLEIKKAIRELRKGLKQNYFLHGREWPYKNIPKRILAEKFMEDYDDDGVVKEELTDYKFFCFNGEPYMMYVSQDHAQNAKTDFFDMEFKRLPIRMKDPNSDVFPNKPVEFEEMKKLARICSKGIPLLRVDFYIINHKIYFGELTFFHNGGITEIHPETWDYKLGEMIKLPNSKESKKGLSMSN